MSILVKCFFEDGILPARGRQLVNMFFFMTFFFVQGRYHPATSGIDNFLPFSFMKFQKNVVCLVLT
jgi:hypothetical protein